MRSRLLFLLLVLSAGCAKQVDLPDIVVAASSKGEFAQFRTDLGKRFSGEQLKDFDTATRELQLEAMNRDIASADAREADMLRAVQGKTVGAVVILGWGARKARFQREIADITGMLERDLALASKSATAGTPDSIKRRIGSEREVLAQLQRHLAETEHHLAEMPMPAKLAP